jgi:glucose/arabinose dehydrogenase
MVLSKTRRLLVLLSTVVVVLAACSSTPTTQPSATPTATDPVPSIPEPTDPAEPSEPASATDRPTGPPSLTAEVVATGFERPVQILPAPDGRVLVIEQPGRVRALSGEMVLDVRDRVNDGANERGLLGAAFAADGTDRIRLYLHYSAGDGATTVSAFDWPNPTPGSEQVLFTTAQPASNHNGGSLLVGPDGMLYLALGDGGAANDRFGNGQRTDTPLGAILRFDVARSTDELVPAADNPFRDGGHPAVWVYGLRNPWRIAFDDQRLWVADVGQDAIEEVSTVRFAEAAGANFGWPIFEGTRCAQGPCDEAGLVFPVVEHSHDEDGVCALIGGVVYDGELFPSLRGHYLYSDACAGFLRTVDGSTADPGYDLSDQVGSLAGILGFGVDDQGEVYLGMIDGRVLTLVPN